MGAKKSYAKAKTRSLTDNGSDTSQEKKGHLSANQSLFLESESAKLYEQKVWKAADG